MPDTTINIDWFKEFSNHVIKRPGMYLGSRNATGVKNLIKGILSDVIRLSEKRQLFFTVEVKDEKTIQLTAEGLFNKQKLMDNLFVPGVRSNISYQLDVLCAVSENCQFLLSTGDITYGLLFKQGDFVESFTGERKEKDELVLSFELSDEIFINYPDYFELGDLFFEFAMLNRHISILLKKDTLPYSNQNFYHFPDGIKRLFDAKCNQAISSPVALFIDECFHEKYYQVGIAFPNCYIEESVVSYAGDILTGNGGSLEDGIILGMLNAFKKYKKNANPLDVDWLVKKKSKAGLKYRLILVCKVESPDDTYDYAGSTKETLYMPKIKKDVSQLINKRFSEYLVNNPECAAQISSFF